MRNYLYATVLILGTALLVSTIPGISNSSESILLSLQIPQNNAEVAGIQKYNIPPLSRNLPVPEISARAFIIKDLTSDTILYQREVKQPLPIASTTKIMTALVASEYFQPNSVLRVKNGSSVSGAKVGLFAGEDLSFRSLLYGMLLNSGNDAAYTIAENYPGSVNGFVSAMNKKAVELNLGSTHFDNPAGFDSPKHFSSAQDMVVMTEEALKNYQLARIFATKETNIVSLDKKYKHQLKNLNRLLSKIQGVLGVKTGYTDAAKENLVTYVERDGRKILLVVLGSDDRFGETTGLIDWSYSNFVWSDSSTDQ